MGCCFQTKKIHDSLSQPLPSDRKGKKMNKKLSIDSLVKAAMLTALSIIFSRFFGIFITPSIKFSFGHLPLMVAGMLLGPIPGALAGLAADLIGVAINAGGTPHFGFTLVSVLTGLIPGIISEYSKDKNISMKVQVGLMVFCVLYLPYVLKYLMVKPTDEYTLQSNVSFTFY